MYDFRKLKAGIFDMKNENKKAQLLLVLEPK